MSARLVLSVVAGLLVALTGAGYLVGEAVRLRRTERKWLRDNLFRRWVRYWRSLVARWWLWWWSWPHVFDVLLGSRRVHVMTTPRRLVWREGKVTLWRFGDPRRPYGEPVVLVHSVVTRPWILDLLPDRSVVRWLVDAGHDVYLVDFGDPDRREAQFGLTSYTRLLGRALAAAATFSPTRRVHVVGYCMGATLALCAVGAWGAGPVASLALVAPPYDTEVPGGMASVLRRPELTPVLALDAEGCVPAAYVREGFHLLRRHALRTAVARVKRLRDKPFQRVVSALSRWAWEQRRVPGALWFDLVDLFRGNALLRGTLRVDGRPVAFHTVDLPVAILVTDRDHIVPIASSLALTRVLPHAEVVRCPAGHVSMLMGHESRTVLLPALDDFLRRAATRPATARPPAPR